MNKCPATGQTDITFLKCSSSDTESSIIRSLKSADCFDKNSIEFYLCDLKSDIINVSAADQEAVNLQLVC